jgi:predicted RNA-binding protein
MTEITVRYGRVSDVNGMIQLDQKIYPGVWQVESTFVERLLERNKRVYKIVEENGELRGYSSLIPLDKRTYDQLISGQIDESKICHHALAYKKGKEVYIYLSSIIVDIFHENRKKYSKTLILELLDWIEEIQETGVVIKEFGMIAITDAGNRVCQSMGFNKVWEVDEHGEMYNVYKGTVEDVRNGIKVRQLL